jgi:hypothetical protein
MTVSTELSAEAGTALSSWLRDHPAASGELGEAMRAHIHLQELQRHAGAAVAAAESAEQHAGNLEAKLDPAGRRILSFSAGTALVAVLLVLEPFPLNWAVQAFGLGAAATWLVTGILLAASVAVMVGLEATRREPRRRARLLAFMTVAYIVLLVMRTDYLATVAGEALAAAFLQALLLTAISAGLVLCGSEVIARARPFRLSRARAIAHRARQTLVANQDAAQQATERMERHLGALRQMLVPWALGSAVPADTDHATWAGELERAVRGFFPGL